MKKKLVASGIAGLEVISTACPLFVPLAEENWVGKPETKRIVRTYLTTIRQKQVDALILGCTHYPLLSSVIRASLQKKVKLIDSPSALLDVILAEAPELLAPQTDPTQDFSFPTSRRRWRRLPRVG